MQVDRAFRALAREHPEIVLALLSMAVPGLPAFAEFEPAAVLDPHQSPLPVMDADWVARAGDTTILHVECQGYRDPGFLDRLFRHHLALALRYPRRRVRSVALWVRPPPPAQRAPEIVLGGVRVEVSTVVLSELSADTLLRRPETACFAAAAEARGRSDPSLRDEIVGVLLASGATERQWALALVLAGIVGRYDAMNDAMRRAEAEMPLIEDLVHLGLDMGFEKGSAIGRLEMARLALTDLFEARGLELDAAARAAIAAESSLERLRRWLRLAAVAEHAGAVFEAEPAPR